MHTETTDAPLSRQSFKKKVAVSEQVSASLSQRVNAKYQVFSFIFPARTLEMVVPTLNKMNGENYFIKMISSLPFAGM